MRSSFNIAELLLNISIITGCYYIIDIIAKKSKKNCDISHKGTELGEGERRDCVELNHNLLIYL
ncbi:MAG: hypothetical protein DRJ13_00755 [Bacteroidetes bacterium]|nr:MAG: hypothetical protein DRJ13_00755 [Bacteroidota bacterium]